MPETISNFQFKIYNYAKGDAESKIWIFPGKGLASHNIKALLVLVRYLLGLSLLVFGFVYSPLWLYCFIAILLYGFWAYRKAGLWGIILQFTSDFAVMAGFVSGLLK